MCAPAAAGRPSTWSTGEWRTDNQLFCEALNAALLAQGGVGHVAQRPLYKKPQNREKTLPSGQKVLDFLYASVVQ